MPTLRRWIDHEYERLAARGKLLLAERFEAFNAAYFAAQYHAALAAIPELLHLAEQLNEPRWRLVVQYYTIPAAITWQGRLWHGLELATDAIIEAQQLLGERSVLALYVREMLLYAWLGVDGPGYADDVLASVDETTGWELSADLRCRYELVRAHALAAQGDEIRAYQVALDALLGLDWPLPYHHNIRALALAWAGRLQEALGEYGAAVRGFEQIGHTIEANGARLTLAETLIRLGRVGEALDMLQVALSWAERLINRAHIGLAQGLIGRTLARRGQHEEAATWLTAALRTLNGLGWQRGEAEYALERLKSLRQAGCDPASAQDALDQARRRVQALRSTDLNVELERL